MKKTLFALALLAWASPAGAQQAIDVTPAALPAQNFGIIADTRMFMHAHVPSFTANLSQHHVMPMNGTVKEVWVSVQTGAAGAIPDIAGAHFFVSLSPKGGAIRAICQAKMTTVLERGGDGGNGQCVGGATFKEGDALILSVQPVNTLATGVAANFILRIAD